MIKFKNHHFTSIEKIDPGESSPLVERFIENFNLT